MLSTYKLISKIPGYYLFRSINYPKLLPNNVVFVTTYKCNSKCKTCNIWKIYTKNPNRESEELTLEEYKKIFRTIGNPYWITVGGGESFLRDDIDKIIISLYNIAHPKIINIPSNGSLPEITYSKIKNILNKCKDLKLILNLSLDHIGPQNDYIRGLNGSFELFKDTINNLKRINNKNFTLGIHTVISKYNQKDFPDIYDYVKKVFDPDSYIIENAQIRREFINNGADISPNEKELVSCLDFFISRLKNDRYKKLGKLVRAFRINYYSSVKHFLQTGRMSYRCYSGLASCQINPYGDVWVCAIKNYPMGNLRQKNYNFRKLWLDSEAENAREEMKTTNCNCTLANTSYTNILLNPKRIVTTLYNFIIQ